MNIRKPVDYSAMFATLDKLVAADLPQMELYCEIGRLVISRPEKGAAVAAAATRMEKSTCCWTIRTTPAMWQARGIRVTLRTLGGMCW